MVGWGNESSGTRFKDKPLYSGENKLSLHCGVARIPLWWEVFPFLITKTL